MTRETIRECKRENKRKSRIEGKYIKRKEADGTRSRRDAKDYIILGLCAVLAIVVIDLIVSLFHPRQGAFAPPDFETEAVNGAPEVAEEMGYTELYQDGMAYRVSVCGVPSADGRCLTVYFTNAAENTCYLKLRILDEQSEMIGETGLLKPDQYVESVELEQEIEAGTPIRLKVMSYDPETYESVGTVVLNVTTALQAK